MELVTALEAMKPVPGAFLWQSRDRPVSLIAAYRWIKSIMARDAQACPKRLRHGYGVHATLCGAQVHMLQRWMGHASISTTAIYSTVLGPEEQQLAKRIWSADNEQPHTN